MRSFLACTTEVGLKENDSPFCLMCQQEERGGLLHTWQGVMMTHDRGPTPPCIHDSLTNADFWDLNSKSLFGTQNFLCRLDLAR